MLLLAFVGGWVGGWVGGFLSSRIDVVEHDARISLCNVLKRSTAMLQAFADVSLA